MAPAHRFMSRRPSVVVAPRHAVVFMQAAAPLVVHRRLMVGVGL